MCPQLFKYRPVYVEATKIDFKSARTMKEIETWALAHDAYVRRTGEATYIVSIKTGKKVETRLVHGHYLVHLPNGGWTTYSNHHFFELFDDLLGRRTTTE